MAKSQYTKNGYRTQQAQRFGGFRGIDFYDSPLEVNPARAVDAENFYVKGGEMHKRDGWEEMIDFKKLVGSNAPIHGIFPYKSKDDSFFIVHAGRSFFRVEKVPGEDYYTAEDITESGIGTAKVSSSDLFKFGSPDYNVNNLSYRSQAFEKDEKLYIVGAGKYLVFGKFFGNLIKPSTGEGMIEGTSESGYIFSGSDVLRAHTGTQKAGDYAICHGGGASQFCKQPNTSATDWEETGPYRLMQYYESGPEVYVQVSYVEYHVYYYSGSEWVMGEAITSDEISAYIGAEKKYELRYVSESNATTIPTVGIGIEVSSEKTYATLLDDVSLVTSRRKETAHSGAIKGGDSSTHARIYTSSKIKSGTHVRITIKYAAGLDSDSDFEDFFVVLENARDASGTYQNNLWVVDGYLVQGGKSYQTTENANIASGVVLNDFQPTVNFSEGYVDFGTFAGDPFGVFYTPDAADNITIEYTADDDGDKTIDKCRFGTTFDIDGGNGRLFLSGNDSHKNTDWHSALDDFTYFGDQNSAVYGQDTPITGYIHLTNNTLAVFKKAIVGEPSVYYRTGSYISTEATNLRVFFTITEGAIGHAALNPSVTWMLDGDSLFLDKDGVYGIVLTEKFKYDERYAKERSRTVKPQIEKVALDSLNGIKPTGIVNDDRLYVFLNDEAGTVLVCDARQRFIPEEAVDNTYQYEWYRYTGVPAFSVTKIDDTIWFGTENGKLARIKKGIFHDRTVTFGSSGDFTVSNGKITYFSTNFPMIENGTPLRLGIYEDAFFETFERCFVSELLCEPEEIDGNVLFVSRESGDAVFDRIWNGKDVLVRNVGSSGLSSTSTYTIGDLTVGDEQYSFRLYSEGEQVTPSETGFKLISRLPEVVYAQNVDKANGTFEISRCIEGRGVVLDATYHSTPVIFDVCQDDPVKAHWITPYTALGSNILEKTLFSLTVCPELHSRGMLTFGYETRRKREAFDLMQTVDLLQANPMSLDEMSFNNFTFETGFAEARTFRVKERNFNYIRFRFISDDAADCGVSDFTVVFKAIKQYRGIS